MHVYLYKSDEHPWELFALRHDYSLPVSLDRLSLYRIRFKKIIVLLYLISECYNLSIVLGCISLLWRFGSAWRRRCIVLRKSNLITQHRYIIVKLKQRKWRKLLQCGLRYIRWPSSGMLRRVLSLKLTDGLKVLTAMRPDDGGSKHLWNFGQFLPDYTAQHTRRQSPSYSKQWEPGISPRIHILFHILPLWYCLLRYLWCIFLQIQIHCFRKTHCWEAITYI
jgi:hypothetical protein